MPGRQQVVRCTEDPIRDIDPIRDLPEKELLLIGIGQAIRYRVDKYLQEGILRNIARLAQRGVKGDAPMIWLRITAMKPGSFCNPSEKESPESGQYTLRIHRKYASWGMHAIDLQEKS